MKLRQALRSSVAAITIASVAAPTGLSAQTSEAAPRGGAQVRVAQAEDFSRIELGGRAVARRDGQVLTLQLAQHSKNCSAIKTRVGLAHPKPGLNRSRKSWGSAALKQIHVEAGVGGSDV